VEFICNIMAVTLNAVSSNSETEDMRQEKDCIDGKFNSVDLFQLPT
jgi:hypothetical protein